MKQSRFLTVFIMTHLFFIFIQIHKHTKVLNHSYKAQEYERLLTHLGEKKAHLTHLLSQLQSHDTVYKFAQNKLGMHPIKLNNIKRIIAPCT